MRTSTTTLGYFMTFMLKTGTKNLNKHDMDIRVRNSGVIVLRIYDKVVFKLDTNGDMYFCMLGENTPNMRKVLRFMGIPVQSFAKTPTVNGVNIDPEAIYVFRDGSVIPVMEFDTVSHFSAEEATQTN